MRRCSSPSLIVVLFSLTAAAAVPVIPRIDSQPTLDGVLNEAAWRDALLLDAFSRPRTTEAPAQPISVRLFYSSRGLHVGAVCSESDPTDILALRTEENDSIWQDDCFGIWVKSIDDASEYDQFIVNSISTRETLHARKNPAWKSRRPSWQASSSVTSNAWSTELFIPYAELGRSTEPLAGEELHIKLGRKDLSAADSKYADYATWPENVKYGRRGEFGTMCFGRDSFMKNTDLALHGQGQPQHWDAGGEHDTLMFQYDAKSQALIFNTHGKYATLQQRTLLPPNSIFSLSLEISGTSGGYLRARTDHVQQPKVTSFFRADEQWRTVEALFPTGPKGECLVLIGTTADHVPGSMKIRNLSLQQAFMRDFMGPAIPVVTDNSTTVIEHIRPIDCRMLKGFSGAPIDGSLASIDWAARYWEYNMPGTGTGVKYNYRDNDGLHITLADRRGVDAIQVRGGIKADVLINCEKYDDPESGKKIMSFIGKAKNSLALFDRTVKSDKFSFFNVTDGVIADTYFFRVGNATPELESSGPIPVLSGGDPGSVSAELEQRYPGSSESVYGLGSGSGATIPALELTAGNPIHILSQPAADRQHISAVSLAGTISAGGQPLVMTIQIQDPVQPWSAVTTVTIAFTGDGPFKLVLDIPDQVISDEQVQWITLTPHGTGRLIGPKLENYGGDKEVIEQNALAFQKLKLKHLFCVISEARPWNVLYRRSDIQGKWRKKFSKYWPWLDAIMTGIAYCRDLDSEDETVRQYNDWFYRRADERAKQFRLDPPELPADPGAPEWAIAARTAWLTLRSVPEWWLKNRGVDTGEFGTEVNDDSCLFQNFANFPVFERDGTGGDVLEHGRKLLDHAIDIGLLINGVNGRQNDPLHAYEDGINHESMLSWWNYGDPVYVEQCMIAARSTESYTTMNRAGHRHFLGSIVAASDIRNKREPDIDGYNHAQLMHPVSEVARYNQNPRAVKFLTEYADAWLEHMQEPGRYATRIKTESDEVDATGSEPFSEGMGCQQSVMLTAAEVTGNRNYVKPLVDFLSNKGNADLAGGYLADLYHLGYLDELKDDALKHHFSKSAALHWAHTGDKSRIVRDLKSEIAEIQTFPHPYTTAEFYADRIFLDDSRKLTTSAKAYTGGYATRNKPYHSHAATWNGFSTNYAALVRDAGRASFSAILFNFAKTPITGDVRFWNLTHGLYEFSTGIDTNSDDRIDIKGNAENIEIVKGDPHSVTLAPRAVTVIKLRRIKRLDSIYDRADLALSTSETVVDGDTVRGIAHNIGSKRVRRIHIALIDSTGVIHVKESIGRLDAPLNLEPQKKSFAIEGLPEDHEGWRVVIDPHGSVAEITEQNNSVALK